ncbi:hypothetical protein BJ878DRAFT_530596 [Calycina marina]|uniref:Uncharacterized protein n=1 Tax=Calycina marina TaxID=1763456 RepID=A0A9P7YU51_9HELO|nr:hypothetical protein BJ878DRAFT_530596 [Calycina marina]
MQGMLTEKHANWPKKVGDINYYVLGRVGEHNVVVVYLNLAQLRKGVKRSIMASLYGRFRIQLGFIIGVGHEAPKEYRDMRGGDLALG